MKELQDLQEELRTLKPRLAREYHVSEIGIFGSVAKGKQHAESDVDLFVSFDHTVSLLDVVRLDQELSDHLEIEVDVVTEGSLKPRIGNRVAADLVYV